MTFREYVLNRRVTDTPAGDFVKEARRLGRFFENATSWDELAFQLRTWTGDPRIFGAARAVWRGYQRHLRTAIA
jgi:hypothetical protein